jgi:hypothetical protein
MRVSIPANSAQLLRPAALKRPLSFHRLALLPLSSRQPAPVCLSTYAPLRTASGPGTSGKSSKTNASHNSNPEYPAFSLSALGLSRNMRMGLLVILSIFGTIETWFYGQAIWRWWKAKQEEKAAETEAEAE